MARVAAIGLQDFGDIIRKNCFYVDKTSFIKEWWEYEDSVTLITRPRRFGKTLNMSMLDYFFSTDHKDDRYLFEQMSIWKEKKYRELQGTYPVIFLSFASVKSGDFKNARKTICKSIIWLYQSYRFLLDEGFLTGEDAVNFNSITLNMDDSDAQDSIKQLSNFLLRYYGKKNDHPPG